MLFSLQQRFLVCWFKEDFLGITFHVLNIYFHCLGQLLLGNWTRDGELHASCPELF